MAELLGAVVDEAVKLVFAPIRRQFSYLCCFTTNISSLKREAKKLDDAAAGVQILVDTAINDGRVILPRVEFWLTKANDIKYETAAILDQVPNVHSRCLKLRPRFFLSKRAKKTTDRMKELRDVCKFDVISLPGPPAARSAVALGKTYEFESRKQIEEDIITILRDGEVSMIGICGMGGLGKTTMAKRIINKVLEEGIFKEVVMAVVSQQVDKLKIQLEICESLGLGLEAETSEAARVQKLHARLSGPNKILLVLDDVWERLELEEFGIPCDSKSCKIILTSRNGDTLRAMDVETVFGMTLLSEEEAWFLFRERVGTCVDDLQLNSIAQEIVKQCSGSPLVLETVGAALRDETDPSIWKDALRQLQQSDPDFPNYRDGVYNPLILSYRSLSSEEAKYLFLLCSLFPKGAAIHVEHLTSFCMGLGIFKGIKNLEEARRKMSPMIEMLKTRSLLLDDSNEHKVKMSAVVHDGCIFIAKQEGYIGDTWISSSKVPDGLRFPNLRLLILSLNSQYEEEVELDSASLEGIRDLSVLCFENYSFTSLPHTIKSLTKLKTLVLDSCEKLNTISVVCELVDLEILICRRCGSLEELPPNIKRLNRLVITGSSGLQSYSFTSLPHTTESVTNLNTLVLDSCEKLQTISIIGELVDVEILIYCNCDLIDELSSGIKGLSSLKLLELRECSSTSLPHTIQSLTNLNTLVLDSCEELKRISVVGGLVNLEILICRSCGLIELPPEIKGLKNLKLLEFTGCSGLQSIDRGIISKLVGLEELKMLESFNKWEAKDREGGNACLVELEALTNLRCLEIEIEDLALVEEKMLLSSKMERFDIRIPAGFGAHHERFNKKLSLRLKNKQSLGDWIKKQLLRDTEFLFLCGNGANSEDLAECQNMRWLDLGGCETMKNIVTPVNAAAFSSIEHLMLFSLPELEEIWDGRVSSTSLKNLEELYLRDLAALRIWKSSQNHCAPLFPKLSSIEISDCPHLRILGQENIAYHNLKMELQEQSEPSCQVLQEPGKLAAETVSGD